MQELFFDLNYILSNAWKNENSIYLYDLNGFVSRFGQNNVFDFKQYFFGDIKISLKDNTYDAITCVGTFTYGHVHPPALDEMTRICKNGGNISFTINVGIYEEYGFDNKIDEMKKDGIWKIEEFFKSNYIKNKGVNAWLCLATVQK